MGEWIKTLLGAAWLAVPSVLFAGDGAQRTALEPSFVLEQSLSSDAGVLLGVTRAAPDVNPFLGASVRF